MTAALDAEGAARRLVIMVFDTMAAGDGEGEFERGVRDVQDAALELRTLDSNAMADVLLEVAWWAARIVHRIGAVDAGASRESVWAAAMGVLFASEPLDV